MTAKAAKLVVACALCLGVIVLLALGIQRLTGP